MSKLFFDDIRFLNIEWIFYQIYRLVHDLPIFLLDAFNFWLNIMPGDSFWIKLFLWLITVIFGGIVYYSIFKTWEINQKEWENYRALFVLETGENKEKKEINLKWVDVLSHLESNNSADWVVAIFECDKILDGLLRERGYQGKDTGEMLKSIEPGKIKNLQEVWEAHKIRNKIAHEPGFILEKRDARKAISQYEATFREMGFLD